MPTISVELAEGDDPVLDDVTEHLRMLADLYEIAEGAANDKVEYLKHRDPYIVIRRHGLRLISISSGSPIKLVLFVPALVGQLYLSLLFKMYTFRDRAGLVHEQHRQARLENDRRELDNKMVERVMVWWSDDLMARGSLPPENILRYMAMMVSMPIDKPPTAIEAPDEQTE